MHASNLRKNTATNRADWHHHRTGVIRLMARMALLLPPDTQEWRELTEMQDNLARHYALEDTLLAAYSPGKANK